MSAPLLVRAARCEPVERTPVWFMRQAGRSLPEYRRLRERHSLFEIVAQPELCAEVTLQPVRRHGVGPVVPQPVASAADVARLRVPDEPVPALLKAIRIVRRELDAARAVVGFC